MDQRILIDGDYYITPSENDSTLFTVYGINDGVLEECATNLTHKEAEEIAFEEFTADEKRTVYIMINAELYKMEYKCTAM